MFDPLLLIFVCGIALMIHGIRGFRVPVKARGEESPDSRVVSPTAIDMPKEGDHATD